MFFHLKNENTYYFVVFMLGIRLLNKLTGIEYS